MKRKFFTNCLMLALPFIMALFIELFVLPVNFYSFRIWEALQVKTLVHILPGPFYPDQDLSMLEVGDLGHGTKHEVKHWSHWATDRFGFRARNTAAKRHIVIVGDSNTAGANVSQDQMLGEVLASNMQAEVYSFAPAYIDDFLLQTNLSPDTVVFAVIERTLRELQPASRGLKYKLKRIVTSGGEIARRIPGVTKLLVYADRLTKLSTLYFARSKISGNQFLSKSACAQEAGTMLFYQGRMALEEAAAISSLQKKNIVSTVLGYKAFFNSRGIRFVFVLIPNKETIYHAALSWPERPAYLDDITRMLESAGVETVNLQPTFEEAQAATNTLLYSLDDTHWAIRGIKIAAAEVQKKLQTPRPDWGNVDAHMGTDR